MLEKIYNNYDNVIFFDTETTGFDFDKDKIIELSFINTDKDNYLNNIHSAHDIYVKTKVPSDITALTGITQQKLDADGVSEKDMVDYLAIFIREKTLLVAHNAQFDISFIRKAFERYGLEERIDKCDYLDTVTVLKDRKAYPHKLLNAIEYYGLTGVKNSHLASDDTSALLSVSLAMAAERDDLDKYINIFGYNPKYGINGKMLDKVFYSGQNFNKGIVPQQYTLPSLIKGKTEFVDEKITIKASSLPKKETRVVIKGEVVSFEFLEKTMAKLFPSKQVTIVSGGDKKGIDLFLSDLAKQWDTKEAIFKSDWKKYHRSAGHVRNAAMINYAAEANGYLVTFGDDSLLKQATKKGLKVISL